MSLEEALNKNTAAVEKHNALLEKLLAAGGKAGAAAPAADKPAAGKPATTGAGKPSTTKGKGAPTVEEVTKKVTEFLKTGDAELRSQRKEQVGLIIQHYGVERFTLIPAENFAEALGYLKDFEEDRTPAFIEEDGGSEGDGDDEAMV